MKVEFTEKSINYDGLVIKYDELKGEKANHILYKLLVFCIENEEKISFESTESCTPFGKKLKEILEEEFINKVNF